MKQKNNYLLCHDCGHVMGPYSDRKMNTMDGTNCDKCSGVVSPVRIGIDLANRPDRNSDARRLTPPLKIKFL